MSDMVFTSLLCAAKRNSNGTFDAEVALSFHNSDGKILKSTKQRTVRKQCVSREAAEQQARDWIENNLFHAFDDLPLAKP